VLVGLVRLPEGEVARVLLARVRLLLLHLVGPLAREAAVVGKAVDAEVDVTLGLVGATGVDQRLDHAYLPGDGLDRGRLDVRATEPEPVGVLDVPAGGVGGELRARA